MIRGTYVKNDEIHEIIHGNGLIELIPEVVEPEEPMKELHALFYFHPRREKQPRIWKNALIASSVIVPTVMLTAFGNIIMNDVIYGGLCWSLIAWVGLVVFANVRRKR